MRLFKAFLADVSGASAVEYGVIAAVISLAMVASFTALGNSIVSTFDYVGNYMTIH